ncbi:hypothetical protein [Coleofasciculus sp. E1-EBD-02]|uniref:hypothetical protein n=1 Tax=Coleofasciculus sp. E1-EBD-02 TaxID=3068481 RepID=UPI0032F6C60E
MNYKTQAREPEKGAIAHDPQTPPAAIPPLRLKLNEKALCFLYFLYVSHVML